MSESIITNTSEQAENMRDPWILKPYRVDRTGRARTDLQTCEVALSAQTEMIALVCRALANMKQEMTDNEHAQVLAGAQEILSQVVETMNAALTTLADCSITERD